MGKFTAFKVQLKGMPVGNQQFAYSIDAEFFKNMESADIRCGAVNVVLDVTHANGTYDLNFVLKGSITIGCDRCLDDMELPIDTTYHLIVKYGEEYNDESDDVLVIPESDNDLNVAYMIYDTIALSIPLKHTHPAGECNKAMTAKLKQHSAHQMDDEAEREEGDEEKTNDPRWDALRDLLDNE